MSQKYLRNNKVERMAKTQWLIRCGGEGKGRIQDDAQISCWTSGLAGEEEQ